MPRWKPIVGYEGTYEVCSDGSVRSLDRVITLKDGRPQTHKGKVLRQFTNKKGYKSVGLFREGEGKRREVHRLVAIAFISNHENKPQVNHIDGNPSNNDASNLEWVTNMENLAHASATGLMTGVPKRVGVSYHSTRGHWQASIKRNGKQKFLGRFDTEEEAIQARELAESEG